VFGAAVSHFTRATAGQPVSSPVSTFASRKPGGKIGQTAEMNQRPMWGSREGSVSVRESAAASLNATLDR
jgi:hypothetical protein